MFNSIRQLIAILDPASRLHFALLLVPMLVITALEIVSISLILPVIQVLLLGQQDGMLTVFILNLLPSVAQESLGLWVTGLFAVFFVGKNLLMLAMIFVVNRVIAHKTAVFTRSLFQAYLSRPLVFHYRNNSAYLLRNITANLSMSFDAIRLILMMALDAMLMFGAVLLLIYVEPAVTLGAAFTLSAVGLIFFHFASPIFRYWGERSMDLEGQIIKWINQSLQGIRDVKLLNAHEYVGAKVGDAALERAGVICRSTTSIHIPRMLIETIIVIGFLGVVLVLLSVEQPPTSVISVLGLYGMAALRLMPSLNRLLTSATDLRRRDAYISTVYHDMIDDITEAPLQTNIPAAEKISFEKEIRLENIFYAYPDAKRAALHGVDLTIGKGQSIGFVGQSGAGKSTLMDVILGLLTPDQGRLLVDGKDAFESLAGWRRRIGFVPQHVFLMDDTISRNIAFGIKDEDIDENRIKEVLRLAKLDNFVLDLPDGLATVLGEHGTRLSGGQRQRIAIARALYRDPDVLMFDEATSALDNETENEVSNAIEALAGEKTVLIVAHRLSTVRRCDLIAFMKDGRITATGSFDELIKGDSEFKHLVELGNFESSKDGDGAAT
ncbi:MAG: ABC transporter ATP-binding protein [Rhodospirillales bacterium]|nr:ABC transporter ATP-binding protein [Rhodospirillales bacterium]